MSKRRIINTSIIKSNHEVKNYIVVLPALSHYDTLESESLCKLSYIIQRLVLLAFSIPVPRTLTFTILPVPRR